MFCSIITKHFRMGKKQTSTPGQLLQVIINKAVLTCQANFNDHQIKSSKQTGELAGFEVVRLLNQPTAGLAYIIDELKSDQKMLVFGLGGGTVDVLGFVYMLNVVVERRPVTQRVHWRATKTTLHANSREEGLCERQSAA